MKAQKQPPVYGDHLPITAFQIRHIRKLCQFDEDYKCAVVASHSGQTSLKLLTQRQAIAIIKSFENPILPPNICPTMVAENWAVFDKSHPKHRYILSLLYQMQWVKQSEKWGEVPDLDRLSRFLQSEKSPVKKKLKDMAPLELEKLITALNGIVKHRYK